MHCTLEVAPVCAGPHEPCFLDPICETPSLDAHGGLGCNAGGKGQECRFCGFSTYVACPDSKSSRSALLLLPHSDPARQLALLLVAVLMLVVVLACTARRTKRPLPLRPRILNAAISTPVPSSLPPTPFGAPAIQHETAQTFAQFQYAAARPCTREYSRSVVPSLVIQGAEHASRSAACRKCTRVPVVMELQPAWCSSAEPEGALRLRACLPKGVQPPGAYLVTEGGLRVSRFVRGTLRRCSQPLALGSATVEAPSVVQPLPGEAQWMGAVDDARTMGARAAAAAPSTATHTPLLLFEPKASPLALTTQKSVRIPARHAELNTATGQQGPQRPQHLSPDKAVTAKVKTWSPQTAVRARRRRPIVW
jgi:hypothetical protein